MSYSCWSDVYRGFVALVIYSCFNLKYRKCILCFFIIYDTFHEPTVDLFVGGTEINDIIPAHREMI